ncbi:MAG TPA: MauE/DoxX family redox-associated membrane protein [Bacteroidota bacterium]|nr:MauE/DoxX family redox-associated membrane protein [Bacteroidota bacterium]
MNRLAQNGYVTLISRCLIGIVFVLAAMEKISLPDEFAVSLQAYQIVPMQAINVIAIFLPWLELVCGIFLLAGICVRSSAAIVSLMLAAFVAGISVALSRHLNIDCGCFGSAHASPIGWQRVVEDGGLFILAVNLWAHPKSVFAMGNS